MDISDRINGLDLFSGIGGISLALSPWVRPIAYCERDTYCQSVLLSNMARARLDTAPIWSDVKTLNSKWFQERETEIDIIFGGFPCQDISVAGNGAGLEGERSVLYWEVHRLVKEIKPAFVFLENVPAIRTRGLREVILSLTDIGYDCRWTRVSAAELGAPHLRKRWFLLAHSKRESSRMESGRWNGSDREKAPDVVDLFRWDTVPSVDRVCDGLPEELDAVKALGNAVVPLQAREAFKRLMGV